MNVRTRPKDRDEAGVGWGWGWRRHLEQLGGGDLLSWKRIVTICPLL